jgi:hypothetical protein
MIEQAAFGHARQRQCRHKKGFDIGFGAVGAGAPTAQQVVDRRGMRKFRCRTESAVVAIERLFEGVARRRERGGIRSTTRAGGRRFELREYFDEPCALRAHLIALVRIKSGDALQQLAESRHAVARLFREVGAAEKRALVVAVEKHRKGPSTAALCQQLMRGLIDLVNIRALFAIDLDVDEQLVHECGRWRVLEGFVRHYVAPVASGITDRQQDRLARLACHPECLIAPRIPVNRVVGMLEQVRARFT